MLRTGFLTIARPFGIELRLHWSTPLGLLVFGGFWPNLALGLGLLIGVHELGHAFVAKRFGAQVQQIDILPFGGVCRYAGNLSPLQKAAVAWGGVWAQGLVFAATVAAISVFGMPKAGLLDGLAMAFTVVNAMLIFTNLLPVEPLDGAEAWPLFKLLAKRYWRSNPEGGFIVAPPLPTEPKPRSQPQPRSIHRGPTDVIRDADLPPEIREAMEKAVRELQSRR